MTTASTRRSPLLLLVGGLSIAVIGCAGGCGGLVWYGISSYEIFIIPQNGMSPGLPAGSRLLSIRQPYARAVEVQRGDIIIFSHAEDGPEIKYIWRVVGLPGDRVQTALRSISINGNALPLVKLRDEDRRVVFSETNGSAQYEVAYENDPQWQPPEIDLVVPPDQFFVLGDNRHGAGKDSRTIGTITFGSIKGKKW